MPLGEVLAKAAIERIRAVRLNRREPGHLRDPPVVARLDERLAERARVAEVAGGDDDPVGRVPLEVLEQLPDDRLLALESKRINGVDEVDAELLRRLEDQAHRRVEVAADLQAECAVRERLREFSRCDFSARN